MDTNAHIDYFGTDTGTGTAYLLTSWDDGSLQLATRPLGQRTWTPPVYLDRVTMTDAVLDTGAMS